MNFWQWVVVEPTAELFARLNFTEKGSNKRGDFMRIRRTLAYFVFASCVVLFVAKNRAAEVHSGDWTISKSEAPGKVEFSLIEHHHGGTSSHQSDWSTCPFLSLDFSKSALHSVHFTTTHD